jgi:predicted DNA-binding transcriptional regulator YafY
MAYEAYKQKLDSLLYYIKSRSAVNTKTLAKNLAVSTRTILRMVTCLREQGNKIKYCDKKKVYFLEEDNPEENNFC